MDQGKNYGEDEWHHKEGESSTRYSFCLLFTQLEQRPLDQHHRQGTFLGARTTLSRSPETALVPGLAPLSTMRMKNLIQMAILS